jgi:ribonuclease HI
MKPETPIQIELFMDNMVVIRKLNTRRKNTRTVNQHRDSYYDVENQIIQEIEELTKRSTSVTIKYVKSHGIKTKKKDLSRIEKTHCQADG